MILEVKTKKQIKLFVDFVRVLYKDEEHYIYPIFYILKKELIRETFINKSYRAILAIEDNQVKGRLLYTFVYNTKIAKTVCYFSYFDCIDDQRIADELLNFMEQDMAKNKVFYSEGSFTPYDPDNRRGIMVKGFSDDPYIFNSYNYPYYQKLLENYGYLKAHDTYSLKLDFSSENQRKLNLLTDFFKRRFDVEIKPLDLKNLKDDLNDVHKILLSATSEEIYQEAPSFELIEAVAKKMKLFLKSDIILIAREKETKEPIGFTFCLLDYNQVFKKSKGRLDLFKLIRPLKHIDRVRGMMQYVVPKYQSTGLIGYLYYEVFEAFKKLKIKDFEAGTMMENNEKPLKAMAKFSAEVTKIYRIYGKEISE